MDLFKVFEGTSNNHPFVPDWMLHPRNCYDDQDCTDLLRSVNDGILDACLEACVQLGWNPDTATQLRLGCSMGTACHPLTGYEIFEVEYLEPFLLLNTEPGYLSPEMQRKLKDRYRRLSEGRNGQEQETPRMEQITLEFICKDTLVFLADNWRSRYVPNNVLQRASMIARKLLKERLGIDNIKQIF